MLYEVITLWGFKSFKVVANTLCCTVDSVPPHIMTNVIQVPILVVWHVRKTTCFKAILVWYIVWEAFRMCSGLIDAI